MLKKMKRLINSFLFNNMKMIIIKIFHFNSFKFSFINYISPLNSIDIQGKGSIVLGEKLNIPSKSYFGVRENGILKIGNGSFINNNCHIISHKKIVIGNNVCIGPNTVIVDHDHIFDKSGVNKKKFKSAEISIGDNVWIGANSVILKGTKIGNNCVVGAGSVINGKYDDNSIIIQKREDYIK